MIIIFNTKSFHFLLSLLQTDDPNILNDVLNDHITSFFSLLGLNINMWSIHVGNLNIVFGNNLFYCLNNIRLIYMYHISHQCHSSFILGARSLDEDVNWFSTPIIPPPMLPATIIGALINKSKYHHYSVTCWSHKLKKAWSYS